MVVEENSSLNIFWISFPASAGMIININKSTISFLNVYVEDGYWICDLFPFLLVDLEDGLSYLGFSLKPNAYLIKE